MPIVIDKEAGGPSEQSWGLRAPKRFSVLRFIRCSFALKPLQRSMDT